jgi:glycine/D-amino acid oxidase-like deaminating enzyme/nitrite reductase/ring-hydroxylating ferredoxin subunit
MHDPLWTHTADLPDFPPLTADATCDVCVVGGGIAGISTAYRLAREGVDVMLVEKGDLASGETRHTSAHLASALDDRFFRIEKQHGEEGARLAAQSHAVAIDWIEAVAAEEGIECGFQRLTGYLFLGPDDDPGLLDRELDASRRAGLAVGRVDRAPLSSFDTGPCLAFQEQARFHPLRFLAGVARALDHRGSRIHTHTRVVGLEDTRSRGTRSIHTADGHTIAAEHVVLATNSPSGHYLTTMKMVPYRTFVIAFRLTGQVADALYWDTADPYHYIRLAEDDDGPLLLIGGGDYQTGTKDAGEESLRTVEAWARERFPVGDVAYAWSGQVLEPADAMAFIGEEQTESRVYVVTGDSGQGLTHGVIGALLLGDLVLGRKNPWEALYAPSRITLSAAPEYAKDMVNIGSRFLEWLVPGEVESEDEVPVGHGAILRAGLKRVAVYRYEAGAVHRRSAVCTHAGCVVHWNSTARGWECPCHGSRFSPTGEVVSGPAMDDLAMAD